MNSCGSSSPVTPSEPSAAHWSWSTRQYGRQVKSIREEMWTYPVQLLQVEIDRPEGEDGVLRWQGSAAASAGASEGYVRALPQVYNWPHAYQGHCTAFCQCVQICIQRRAAFPVTEQRLRDLSDKVSHNSNLMNATLRIKERRAGMRRIFSVSAIGFNDRTFM